MKSQKQNAYSPGGPSSLFPSRDVSSAFRSQRAVSSVQETSEGRLTWLDLHTRPANVRQAVTTLLKEAMKDTSDAKRAGLFLLSLWSPGRYPLDLNELGFFERELNYAVRHLLNFIIAGQVNIRMILTHSEMAPVMAAWGEEEA